MRKHSKSDSYLHLKRERRTLAKRRAAKRSISTQEREARRERRGPLPDEPTSTIDHFTTQRQERTLVTTRKIVLPKTFSFLDDPEAALKVIHRAAAVLNHQKIKFIYIDHRHVERVGLAAEVVLDRVVDDMFRRFTRAGRRVKLRGRVPADPNACRLIRAIGLTKALGIRTQVLSDEDESRVRVFQSDSRAYVAQPKINIRDYKEKTVGDFVAYTQKALGEHGHEMTNAAKARLISYLGEILDNVEQHSGVLDWILVGYIDLTEDGLHWFDIAVLNFGLTYAETFSASGASELAWGEIQGYLDKHRGKGGISDEGLVTVCALQGNISSKNYTEEDTRGHGTVKLIEFFQDLHESFAGSDTRKPKMAIVSGNTRVLFDGRYKMKMSSEGRKVIAFNNPNDLDDPPDMRYVSSLRGKGFPGCAISIRFPLPARFVRNV